MRKSRRAGNFSDSNECRTRVFHKSTAVKSAQGAPISGVSAFDLVGRYWRDRLLRASRTCAVVDAVTDSTVVMSVMGRGRVGEATMADYSGGYSSRDASVRPSRDSMGRFEMGHVPTPHALRPMQFTRTRILVANHQPISWVRLQIRV